MLALLALLCLSAPVQDDLPADLKPLLADVRRDLEALDGKIARQSAAANDVAIDALKLRVEELMLEADRLPDSPTIKPLRESLDKLRQSARASAEKKMAEMAARDEQKMAGMMGMDAMKPADPLAELPVNLDDVSFKKDVAPIFRNVCVGCHNAQRSSGDVDLSTYAKLMDHIEAGDPDSSHALMLVTGKAEPAMPRGGQSTFTKQWVAIWTNWIRQGAKFDGPGNAAKSAPLSDYLIDYDTQRRQMLAGMPTPQLQQVHADRAAAQIRTVAPSDAVHQHTTPDFLVATTLPEADAEYVGVLAQAVLEDLRQDFAVPTDEPVFRGRLGVNVFARRFDYLAFAREIDGLAPEPEQYGHATMAVEHQYVAATTEGTTHDLDGIVAELVTQAYLKQLGDRKLPQWAVHGYGRVQGHEFSLAPHRYDADLAEAYRVAATGRDLTHLFAGQIPWVQLAPLAESFFRYATDADRERTTRFLTRYADGADWNATVVLIGDPAQLTPPWQRWLQKHAPKR